MLPDWEGWFGLFIVVAAPVVVFVTVALLW